jgi:hypothetical protein
MQALRLVVAIVCNDGGSVAAFAVVVAPLSPATAVTASTAKMRMSFDMD